MRFTARAGLGLAAAGVMAGTMLIPATLIATPPAVAAPAPSMSASPNLGLHDGESVTVTGSNFAASKAFYMVQCSGSTQADCDTSNLVTGTTGSDGSLSASFTVHTGSIGAGTCTSTSTSCVIAATTDPNPSDTAAAARAPISFGQSGPSITVSPHKDVKSGSTVKVSGSGFPANKVLYVLECSSLTGQAGCDVSTLNSSAKTDKSGAFSKVKVKVHTGKVGNKSCNAGGTCYIAAATSTTPDSTDSADASFSFAKQHTKPALTIKPNKGVRNGGHVRVSGKGFPVGKKVDLIQCWSLGTRVSCNERTFRTSSKTNGAGAFKKVKMKVFAGKRTKKSCKAGGKCYFVIGTSSTKPSNSNSAVATFTFGRGKETSVTVKVKARRLVGKVHSRGKGVAGLRGIVQRKAGHKWKKVAKVKTHHHGRYRSRSLKRHHKYRVVVPKQHHHGKLYARSVSRTVKV
ncbi:MAG TPA: neocarzinostatin apoprotein domain-containing protein [Mycobacteriales bacterium]|nr:neocarzinostatin apoprotein domain-containing protein [Mycobacteriales bacterium]